MDKKLLGAAGEHLVMYELLKRGYIAGLAPEGAPLVDVIVTNPSCHRTCTIQVKTTQQSRQKWRMGKKNEGGEAHDFFYCLVELKRRTRLRRASLLCLADW